MTMEAQKNDVVVTAVSLAGCGTFEKNEVLSRLNDDASWALPLPSDLPTWVLDQKDLKRVDLYIAHSVYLTLLAAREAGLLTSEWQLRGDVEPERLGVYLSSSVGVGRGLESHFFALAEKGKLGATFIPYNVSHMASAFASLRLATRGAQFAPLGGAAAVAEAVRSLSHGVCDVAVAGYATGSYGKIESALRAGAGLEEHGSVLVLETRKSAVGRGAKIISGIEVVSEEFSPSLPKELGAPDAVFREAFSFASSLARGERGVFALAGPWGEKVVIRLQGP